jgi:hypothetical protein
MIFPEIFITGELPQIWSKDSLLADGLCGWACCMAGCKPPINFGKAMSLIGQKLGTSSPDGLYELADKVLLERQQAKIKP